MELETIGKTHHRQEDRHRRHRSPHIAGGDAGRGGRAHPRALKHIPPERLVISSDCGMGREGMSRRHAYYKMVSLVQGTNIVRKELGLPGAPNAARPMRAIRW